MSWITVTTTKEMDAQDIRDMVWSGAKDRVESLTDDQIDTIIDILADEYPDGIDETALNDFFWFEGDTYAEWLGYKSEEDMFEGRDSDYYDDTDYATIRITHGESGIDDEQSVEDFMYDIKDETEGDYLVNDDSEEDYDDDAEKYIGSVTVDVSNAIIDYLNEHDISYAGA